MGEAGIEDVEEMELVGVAGAEESEPLSLIPPGLLRLPLWTLAVFTGTS